MSNWDHDTLINSLDVVNGAIENFRNHIFDLNDIDRDDIIESLNYAKSEIDSWIMAVENNDKFSPTTQNTKESKE